MDLILRTARLTDGRLVDVHVADGTIVRVAEAGTEDEPTGAHHGLVGMVERAALFGGRVEARPTRDGGFRVLATLPLAPT